MINLDMHLSENEGIENNNFVVTDGHGLIVPKLCAESIFPPQKGVAAEQLIIMTDTQGMDFEFRYTSSASNKVLTTGWFKCLDAKRLVAGDVVLFMRKINTGKLFIGVRKALKDKGLPDY